MISITIANFKANITSLKAYIIKLHDLIQISFRIYLFIMNNYNFIIFYNN